MFGDDIRTEDLNEFQRVYGKKQYKLVLEALGRGSMFIQCLETEIGEMLLKELVEELAGLLEKIVDNPDCDEKVKIKYRILRGIARRWAVRINNYYGNVTKIKSIRS